MKAKQTHTAILTQYLDFLYEVQKYEKILHEVDILSEKLDNPLVSTYIISNTQKFIKKLFL